MSELSSRIMQLEVKADMYDKDKQALFDIARVYDENLITYQKLVETQRVLNTISDKQFNDVLSFISSIINKALLAMYPEDRYRFELVSTLFSGKHPHINAVIQEFVNHTGTYEQLSIKRGIGNGQAQVISYLFLLSMYKVSNLRPIILIDEVLTGFHKQALEYVIKITEVFAKEGFQFIGVEYSFENFGDVKLVRKNASEGYSTIEDVTWEELHSYFSDVEENDGLQEKIEFEN